MCRVRVGRKWEWNWQIRRWQLTANYVKVRLRLKLEAKPQLITESQLATNEIWSLAFSFNCYDKNCPLLYICTCVIGGADSVEDIIPCPPGGHRYWSVSGDTCVTSVVITLFLDVIIDTLYFVFCHCNSRWRSGGERQRFLETFSNISISFLGYSRGLFQLYIFWETTGIFGFPYEIWRCICRIKHHYSNLKWYIL